MTEIEQALIVAAVLDNDAAMTVNIGPEHFSNPAGAAIWDQIVKNLTMGKAADGVTLQSDLVDHQHVQAFASAMTVTASPANIQHYAGKVRDDHRRRQIKEAATRAIEDDSQSPDQMAATLMTTLLESDNPDRKSDYSARDLMAKTIERVDSAATGQALGQRTGWRSIDQKLGGWHKGDLTIVAGRPGMGKSVFGMNAAEQAARLGAKVGFVSTEMDAVSLGMRLAASSAGLSITDLRRGQIDQEGWSRLAKASSDIANLPLRVLEASGWSMAQIVRQCHAWKRYGLDLVVIDYLQRTRPDLKSDRQDLMVGRMAQDCKTMATQLEIPVLLLSQLSRGLESRQDKRPQLSDLRESGQIEQEADNVIMLYRDAVYDESADEEAGEILVEKQRQGPIGAIDMRWDGAHAKWSDVD
jgi:replicative DNA helicase